MANKKLNSKQQTVAKLSARIIKEGEVEKILLSYSPDPLKLTTDIRKLLQLTANTFDHGIRTLVSVIAEMPAPTDEELKEGKYNFGNHGGAEVYSLYNYKKALLEEIKQTVEKTLVESFHDIFFVQGAEEKIFQQLREKKLANKTDEIKIEEDKVFELTNNKGEVN